MGLDRRRYFSAFLDNVTTIFLIVPVAISLAKILGIHPVKLVIPMIIASNLGRPLSNILPKGHNPKRVLYFVISLSGMAIMFGYKSSLTAELAIRREDLPFDSLESLLKSEYR